jgi:hypothetical protein
MRSLGGDTELFVEMSVSQGDGFPNFVRNPDCDSLPAVTLRFRYVKINLLI